MDLAPAAQVAFLQRACGADSELLAQVQALLDADRQPIEPLRYCAPPSSTPSSGQVLASGASDVQALSATVHLTTADDVRSVARADSSQLAVRQVPGLPVPGERIEQYEIIRELGRGGMGAVYLARDTKLARRVAIKFLVSGTSCTTERFIVEARATARCIHENIVVIHEVDEYRGNPFMVLEYVQGKPLAELLDGKPMSAHRIAELLVPVVRALVCAHERGIVHRDLKPDNIVVTDSGAIKVLDFGIAKLRSRELWHTGDESGRFDADSTLLYADGASQSRDDERLAATNPGALLGTLPYMSPEQWQGAGNVDHLTDIWAIGITMFEMAVGRHPLQPRYYEDLVVTKELSIPMPDVRECEIEVFEPLARVIDGCLRKPKNQRIASARDLLHALEPLLPIRQARSLEAGESPYPGLLSFQEHDAHRYFGRTREIANILARIRSHALLGISGPTGIGKSSFIRAGMLPALQGTGDRWESFIVRPGRNPFTALATLLLPLITKSLNPQHDAVVDHLEISRRLRAEPGYLGTLLRRRARQNGSHVLLVIDPFEELYTLSADASERRAFTACLAGAADDPTAPVRVLVSIRSDFLDRIAEDPFFVNELTAGLMFLPPPDRDSLEDALTSPARMAGYRFENRKMVQQILDEVESATGSLPLLQFAATKLWQSRDTGKHLLTERSYDEIGGIVGALAAHADQVVRTLTRVPSQASSGSLPIVQAIFRRLVTVERTRAITPMSELCQLSDVPEEVQRILDRLVDERLLVVHSNEGEGGANVELIHDSLIHSWPTLRRWLDESADDAVFLEQLRTAAKQWHRNGRPSGLLWRGETMDEATRWHRRYRGHLPALEAEYLSVATTFAERALRIKRLLIVGTIGFLVLLVGAGSVMLLTIRQAEHRAKTQAAAAEDANAQLQVQLDVVKREKRQRAEAESLADDYSERVRETGAELDQAYIALQNKVVELRTAIARATEQSAKALDARRVAEDAHAAADREARNARNAAAETAKVNAVLEQMLEQERARNERLERKAGKINRTLK